MSLRGLPTESDENSWGLLQMSPYSVHLKIRGTDAKQTEWWWLWGVWGGKNTFSPRFHGAPRKQPETREGKKEKEKKKNFTGSVSPTSTHNNNTSSRFRSRLSSLEKANYSAARGARGEVSLRSRDDGYSPPFPRADTRKLIKIKVVSRKPREQLASLVFACLNK